jgi:peptide/nickel transport system permease protein
MLAFAVRRLLASIPVMLGSTMVVFLLVCWRTDPASNLEELNPRPPQDVIDALRHRMGWDEPIPVRYWHWLERLILHGDFGPSVQLNLNIGHEVGQRLTVTLRLVLFAVLIALVLGVVTGVLSAVRQYSAMDYSFTFFGFLFLSMPAFWLAILLKQGAIAYNQATGAQTFFTIQDKTPDSLMQGASPWAHVGDIAGHMVLPTISLALITYAGWSRFTRGSMLETLNSDYIRLARAKGLRWRRVLVRHALRTALIPLTTISALDIAAILGGTVITEAVYQWHGMGEFLLNSIATRDVYAVLAWLLVAGLIVILFNLIADLLYGVLDPRIRNG